ncbi:SAM-dependent DNA methyltransferase [Sinorhizobium meliloti]|uniref:Eco57I restriction-modification methylase domain-containing protein n=1 Tax=Rhizobium meliloti TaxID=382 RepID=UPI001296F9FE|nr:SAM-dependent DNA methyltransferase [Sinorhizobium meliloti]MQW40783.1 SAM-dependent DNA methyltransferase [Sinorhizobium meliloti]
MRKRIDIDAREKARLALQARLDGEKTPSERNRLGQFATPTALAEDILGYARSLLPADAAVRFLDPAIGTGSFYSALLKTFPAARISEAQGFEIDPHYGAPAVQLWGDTPLSLTLTDFTLQDADPRFNLLICNPPYVRHHHMPNGEKGRLQLRTQQACGTRIAGLAGLYCYFMGLSQAWLAPGAISGWLIPSEFMDVNYGQAVKRYLLDRVTLLHIHRFDPSDVQFADALVSSAVVWFRNELPPAGHAVEFSFGGTMAAPKISKMVPAAALAQEKKWTRFPAADVRAKSTLPTISDFFKIKRGLATGDNGYFILSAEDIEARNLPLECFRPILPSPRYVKADEIEADARGLPLLDRRLFLLDPSLPEQEIKRRYPSLFAYLEEGKARGLHERYLCSHRALWYAQENRPPAPIVCTYMGRGDTKTERPFRFILNHSQATVANVYLAMYPTPVFARALADKPGLIRPVWEALNRVTPEQLLGEGRVYGGGLHKLEPKELANVPVPEIATLLPDRPVRQAEMLFEAAE